MVVQKGCDSRSEKVIYKKGICFIGLDCVKVLYHYGSHIIGFNVFTVMNFSTYNKVVKYFE